MNNKGDLDSIDTNFLLNLAEKYLEIKDETSARCAYLNVLMLDSSNKKAQQRIFDLTGEKYITKGSGHSDAISCAIWLNDGLHIASGGADNMVLIWYYPTGRIVRFFDGHRSLITAMARHPKLPILASGSEDGLILIHNVFTCKRKILEERSGKITRLMWSPEGKKFVSSSSDGTVIIWDENFEPLFRLREHRSPILNIKWSLGGRYLLSYSADGVINVWNPRTGRLIYRLGDIASKIYCADWSPRGDKIVTASADGSVKIFDIKTRVPQILGQHDSIVSHVLWLRSDVIVSIGWDGKIIMWDPFRMRKIRELGTHMAPIIKAIVNRNEKFLVTVSLDRRVRVWDLRTFRHLTSFRGHTHTISYVDWHPNQEKILTASWDGSIIVWNIYKQEQDKKLYKEVNTTTALDWSKDGRILAAGFSDGSIAFIDMNSMEVISKIRVHNSGVSSLSWNSESTLIASTSFDSSLAIIDPKNNKIICRNLIFSLNANSCRFNPKENIIVACSDDSSIRIVDGDDCRVIRTIKGHIAIVSDVTWSRDGALFASCSWDGTVRIWRKGSDVEYLLIKHPDKIMSIDWNPKADVIAFGSSRGTVHIWNINTREEIASMKLHDQMVVSVRWSYDGVNLASCGRDGLLVLYNLVRKKTKKRHLSSPINTIVWNPNRRNIAVGCKNGDIVLINMDIF